MTQRAASRLAPYLFVLMIVALLATAVLAHDAVMTKSKPANGELLAESPPEVIAWFAEELISGESTMAVFNGQGIQVDNGDGGVDLNDPDHASMIVTLPPLPDGSYTVQWHVALLDGDATDGAFAFGVGEDVSAGVVSPPEPNPAAEESAGGLSTGVTVGIAVVLALLLLVGGLALRRRQ